MEIALVEKKSLKIKNKTASIVINPTGKPQQWNAIILIGEQSSSPSGLAEDGTLIINGPGEYEVLGVKISGIRNKTETVYSMNLDGVEVLFGTITGLSENQQKVKDHNIVCAATDTVVDASFVTSVASNAVLFYGDKADEVVHSLAKEGVKSLPKYQTTLDKLPSEMETVLLA